MEYQQYKVKYLGAWSSFRGALTWTLLDVEAEKQILNSVQLPKLYLNSGCPNTTECWFFYSKVPQGLSLQMQKIVASVSGLSN